MDMSQTVDDLFKYELGIALKQATFAFDEAEKVTTTGILHDHKQMLATFKDFEKSDYI